jgi:hypothetical protein
MRFDLWMMRTYPNIPFERNADKTIGLCNAQTRSGDYERTADRVTAYPGAPAAVTRAMTSSKTELTEPPVCPCPF